LRGLEWRGTIAFVRELRPLALCTAVLVALFATPAARADDDDVRVERRCTGPSTIELRLRERDDDRLRADFRVRTGGRGAAWSVVVVHERRIAFRGRARTGSSSAAFARRLSLPDWPGRDTVTVRALGPRGEVCRASATVRED
jgi:hypothetical protein